VLWTYACLFITYLCSCFYFSYCLILFTTGIGHGFAHVHFYPNKDRSIVMLTSSIRLCYLLYFKASEWILVCWQIALYSYMSSHLAF
jgi:hypothetical protein